MDVSFVPLYEKIIQNLLLVSSNVSNIIQYSNINTISIVYDNNTFRVNLMKLLTDKFVHFNRISFVFHTNSNFLNGEPFFTNDDLIGTQYSDNLQFIINIINYI